MEMDKEARPKGTSGSNIQAVAGSKAKADSGSPGERGQGVWVNEQGELCIGTSCFSLAVNAHKNEVRVRIDRNECGADIQPFIDDLLGEIVKGAPTVYETKSLKKKEEK